MSRVLAMIDDSPHGPGVLQTATSFAGLLDADVDAVTVLAAGERAPDEYRSGPSAAVSSPRIVSGTPEEVLQEELEAHDVVVGVLGTRTVLSHPQLLGHIARAVAVGSSTPLVLVPPGSRGISDDHPVFLVPLDGEHRTSESVAPIAELLLEHGAELIVLHVYDSTTVPMFNPSRHESSILADEFLARHVPSAVQRAEVRIGTPAQHILDAARRHHVDVIVLAWHQDLGPGRAQTLQRVLGEAEVPVLLAPCR